MALFAVAPPEPRREFLQAYRAQLQQRDGQADPRALTLSRREEQLQQHRRQAATFPRVPTSEGQLFFRNQRSGRPKPGLSPRMLWTLALAKINRGETFGIDYKLMQQGVVSTDIGSLDLYIEIEELYHTKTIPVVLRYLGLDAEILRPTWVTRQFLRLLVMAPRYLSDILIMSSEVVGVATFRCLIEAAEQLFGDQAEIRQKICELLNAILQDEIGHVLYVRCRLSAWQLRVAQAILPLVAYAILRDTPELWILLGRDKFLQKVYDVQLENLV